MNLKITNDSKFSATGRIAYWFINLFFLLVEIEETVCYSMETLYLLFWNVHLFYG
jgi:hypothetical protein